MTIPSTTTDAMSRSLRAGALYFAIVFAIGFVLGTIRVLAIVPTAGDVVAVLIELPILLTLAWIVCARVMHRNQVPRRCGPRLVVAASSLLLLVTAEFALSLWLFGNSAGAYLDSMTTPHGAIGLAGQVAFALFPVIQLVTPPEP